MKYLIAVPCMDMVNTMFMMSLISLNKPPESKVAVCRSSLVYDSRNKLAEIAVNNDFDRVLWLDSDMSFEPDMMTRLIADMDEGREFVCGIYHSRKTPIRPVIYAELRENDGVTEAINIDPIPENSVFEIAAAGFGCVMMNTDVLKRAAGENDYPFVPIKGWGEDLSFCVKAKRAGVKLWCDSGVKVGHIGQALVDGFTGETVML